MLRVLSSTMRPIFDGTQYLLLLSTRALLHRGSIRRICPASKRAAPRTKSDNDSPPLSVYIATALFLFLMHYSVCVCVSLPPPHFLWFSLPLSIPLSPSVSPPLLRSLCVSLTWLQTMMAGPPRGLRRESRPGSAPMAAAAEPAGSENPMLRRRTTGSAAAGLAACVC